MKNHETTRSASPAITLSVLLTTVLALSGGCGKPAQQTLQPGNAPPPEVGIVTLAPETVRLTSELPGRIEAVRGAEVRARATGILLKKLFTEGSDVKSGDVLFEIDPAPMQAALDSAKASLAKAVATLAQAKPKAERYKSLVGIHGVSQQDYDDAVAAQLQAEADIAACKAAVETAELNLGYTSVTAPISGRIGPAIVTEGALVSATEATQMAMIQQLDPIYCDFTESTKELLRLRRELDAGKFQSVGPGAAKVNLVLEDGSEYPEAGKLLFSDVSVDPSTGMVTLRAEFPNSKAFLLPGMFVRGRMEEAVDTQAIMVPERGIVRGAGGMPSALVVGADDKVEARPLQLGQAVGDKWIVLSGLKAGDRVIVDGVLKVMPGAPAKPVPFAAASGAAAPQPAAN
jgi:membrane fusion protein (multidrug efflux system)